MYIYPAHTFTDMPTIIKRCLWLLLSLLGHWGFAYSKQNSRAHRTALASWLHSEGSEFDWHSSKDIAKQDTQRMRSLRKDMSKSSDFDRISITTRKLQAQVEHHRGEPTDKIPVVEMQERVARLHQQHVQRYQTAPIPRIPTGVLMSAYNTEARAGLPRGERTTAALKRISSPLSLQETQREHPVVLSPMRKRAIEKRTPTSPQHTQHTIAPVWPRQRNTLRSIRLVKDDS